MTKTDTRNLILVSLITLTLTILGSTTGCAMSPKDMANDDVVNPLPPVNPVGPASPDVESEDPTEEEPEPEEEELVEEEPEPEEEPCDDACELPSDEEIEDYLPTVLLADLTTTTLVNGSTTIGRVMLTADTIDDIEVYQVVVSVHGTVTHSDMTVREVGYGTSLDAIRTGFCLNDLCTEQLIWLTLDEPLTIPAGTSKTLEFRTTTTGVCSGDWSGARFLVDATALSDCDLTTYDGRISLESRGTYFVWSASDIDGFHNGAGMLQPDVQWMFAP